MSLAAIASSPETAVQVFVSYSHKDAYWLDTLLPLLRFPGARVKPWNDKEIGIKEVVERARERKRGKAP